MPNSSPNATPKPSDKPFNGLSDEKANASTIENIDDSSGSSDASDDSLTNDTTLNSRVSSDTTPAYAKTSSHLSEQARLSTQPQLIANGSQAFIWYVFALFVVAIDQWTKWLAETKLAESESISVIEPILNWTLAYNKGAAFSLLANQPGWQKWFFVGISVFVSIFLIIYIIRIPRQAKWLNLGLALILSGAVGNNLIDRVRLGKVVDFIHVHYANVWHYPIFNIADIAICIGVALVLIDMLFLEKKRESQYQT